MHSQTTPRVQEPQTPNLIPMIDVMFLLLLFFLLGADMSAREKEDVVLAEAEHLEAIDPKVVPTEPESTLNVHHSSAPACVAHDEGRACRDGAHWQWSLAGHAYDEAHLAQHLEALAATAREATADSHSNTVLSRRRILIRADESAPYGKVQKAIELCGNAALHRLSIVGALPPRD